MDPLFPPWADVALRLLLAAAGAAGVGVPAVLFAWVRSPAVTGEGEQVGQPISFDHRHHVRDDGIACLYCHSGAERHAVAGIPGADVCMGCHAQVWNESAMLEPVRESARTGEPIAWTRVNVLPDFVYFHHGVHVANGVACAECHGAVEDMPAVLQAAPLQMAWCLDCHRARGAPTYCSTCHR